MAKQQQRAAVTGDGTGASAGDGTGAGAAIVAPPAGVVDDLAGVELDADANDGLAEIDEADIRIPAKVFNMKGVGADGRKIAEDAFYDTIDETVTDEIDAAFLDLHKTNLYTHFDESSKRNQTVCRSFDRVTGTMDTGVTRPCEGCPDDVWRTGDDGKRRKNCGVVYNMLALDLRSQMPFVIRFKRTSLPAVKSHLQKYHIGRRVMAGGKRGNYPLYMYSVKLRCKMSDNGMYAVPVIERGERLPDDQIRANAEGATLLRAQLIPILSRLDDAIDGGGGDSGDGGGGAGGAPDTSFDTAKFDAAAGKNFVE